MDPSALIFVALAIAWGVYLIPKALQHHDDSVRTRSVDRFSSAMRVVARKGPAGAAAPVAPEPVAAAGPIAAGSAAEPPLGRREATRRATQRRRRVLGTLLVVLAGVAVMAGLNMFGWVWFTAPVVLIGGWLVLCRVMVTSERKAYAPVGRPAAPVVEAEDDYDEYDSAELEVALARNEQGFSEVASYAETSVVNPRYTEYAEYDADYADGAWEPEPQRAVGH